MRLNHINLPVTDVAASKLFFEQYFDFTCTQVKGDHALAVLKGADGFSLVLMSQAFNKDGAADFPSAFHVGFLLERKEDVAVMYEKLHFGGIHLEHAPGNMRGVFGFYFMAPGNILVEVSSGQ